VLENVDGAASVLAAMLKSPADKAGIQPGDRLTLVDDSTVAGLDARTLELRLAGDKGSKVHLRFERAPRLEPDTFSVTLKRDYLKVPSVSIVRLADPDAAGHAGCPRELDECPRGVGYAARDSVPGTGAEPLPRGGAAGLVAGRADRA
jgi:C-terminal processing protease CtpA/Prc